MTHDNSLIIPARSSHVPNGSCYSPNITPIREHPRLQTQPVKHEIQEEEKCNKPGQFTSVKAARDNYPFEEVEQFPYRRGQKTLEKQHNLLTQDYDRQRKLVVWDRNTHQ